MKINVVSLRIKMSFWCIVLGILVFIPGRLILALLFEEEDRKVLEGIAFLAALVFVATGIMVGWTYRKGHCKKCYMYWTLHTNCPVCKSPLDHSRR